MSLVTQTQVAPQELSASVLTAVREGAWAVPDVVATVASQMHAARSDVVAVLWDLTADGLLAYDTGACYPTFRPTPVAA